MDIFEYKELLKKEKENQKKLDIFSKLNHESFMVSELAYKIKEVDMDFSIKIDYYTFTLDSLPYERQKRFLKRLENYLIEELVEIEKELKNI